MDTDAIIAMVGRLGRVTNVGAAGVAQLAALLRAQPDLVLFDNKMQYYSLGYSRATLEQLAFWLVRRAEKTAPSTAVADLQRYLGTEAVPHRGIMILGAVKVDAPISVSRQIDVLPFDALSSLHWKESLAKQFASLHENYRPSAALQQRLSYPKRHIEPGDPTSFPKAPYADLEDVRLCMTAIGPSAPVMLGTWTEPDEWVPAVGGFGAAIPQMFNLGGFPRIRGEIWAGLPQLHSAWLQLNEPERKHLRVPLKRLNMALRREDRVDSAIELGIAIDALFLAEREPDRGELGLTLRLRAARLLGEDLGSRRDISKFFSTLYKVRSAAVHAGTLSEEVDGVQVKDLLDRGYSLTALAARKIIQEGEPDWSSLLLS